MKKLLGILGTLVISSIGASLVVACKTPNTKPIKIDSKNPTNKIEEPTKPINKPVNTITHHLWSDIFKDSIAGADIQNHQIEEIRKQAVSNFIYELRGLTPNTDKENKEWAEPNSIKKEIDSQIDKEEEFDLI
ncbi:lipoprotein, partial [Mycoplasma mycoides]